MVGWHHQFDEHEFEQAPGDGERQRSLLCFSPWGHKESDMIKWLNINTQDSLREEAKYYYPDKYKWCVCVCVCFKLISIAVWLWIGNESGDAVRSWDDRYCSACTLMVLGSHWLYKEEGCTLLLLILSQWTVIVWACVGKRGWDLRKQIQYAICWGKVYVRGAYFQGQFISVVKNNLFLLLY